LIHISISVQSTLFSQIHIETWLIYAILSMFITWFFNFGFKIITKRNYNTSYVSIIAYGVAAAAAWVTLLFSDHWSVFELSWIIFALALLNVIFYFLSTLSRVKALHNIDTTIFFPVYKTFFPIILTIVSYFYFQEKLLFKEFVGVILWILVPLMLITKSENSIQKNLKFWIILCILTSIFASVSSLANKFVSIYELEKNYFIFISLFLGTFIAYISYKYFDHSWKKEYSKKGIFMFSFILGLLQYFGFYTFTHAMEWNLAIVITLNSFSILIPIILSVFFYHEQMTFKKALVIFLSIVSVVLFI
jgi:drug/metabolite transporter (DMT)-like permease